MFEMYLLKYIPLLVLSFSCSWACYDSNGWPVYCEPNFANIVQDFRSSLTANSTCGQVADEKVCLMYFPSAAEANELVPECEMCVDKVGVQDNKKHPITHVTKSQLGDNQNCWVSKPGEAKPVAVDITFDTLMQTYYIVLNFCNEPANDITILKTMDFGLTYQPIHFISRDCLKDKGIAPNQRNSAGISCNEPLFNKDSATGIFYTSDALESSDAGSSDKQATGFRVLFDGYSENIPLGTAQEDEKLFQIFSLYSLDIGGKCECNGHASACTRVGGKARCECEHNTKGRNCESCLPLYQDLPWQPSTPDQPFECKKCSCNGHSDSCIFNEKTYRDNGGTGGGVCVDCKHNTGGRLCHLCLDGFYRTPNTRISDPNACSPCNCHQLGSVDPKKCDPVTGQCQCKENVKGKTCAVCTWGVSGDDENPCKPASDSINSGGALDEPTTPDLTTILPDYDDNSGMMAVDGNPSEFMMRDSSVCYSTLKKVLGFSDYCDYSLIIEVRVQSSYVRVGYVMYQLQLMTTHNSVSEKVPEYFDVVVPVSLINDKCINFQVNGHFYILTNKWALLDPKEYHLDGYDVILKVKDSLTRKVTKFSQKKLQNKC